MSQDVANSKTVLIVDDEKPIVELMRHLLTRSGYDALTASDGMEGLARFREFTSKIDLVVTDVLMPKMNGTDMVRAMLSLRQPLRVIFVTGYTDETVSKRLAQFHYEVVRKPFDPSDLLARIAATIGPARHR